MLLLRSASVERLPYCLDFLSVRFEVVRCSKIWSRRSLSPSLVALTGDALHVLLCCELRRQALSNVSHAQPISKPLLVAAPSLCHLVSGLDSVQAC